jgi:hypothetical protein
MKSTNSTQHAIINMSKPTNLLCLMAIIQNVQKNCSQNQIQNKIVNDIYLKRFLLRWSKTTMFFAKKKLSKCYRIIDIILFKIHSNIFPLQKNR